MANNPHNPAGLFLGYAYCIKCGLVYIRNKMTRKAIKAPCPGTDEDK